MTDLISQIHFQGIGARAQLFFLSQSFLPFSMVTFILVNTQVLIYSPARTASQQGSGKVGRWKINFVSTQKYVSCCALLVLLFFLMGQTFQNPVMLLEGLAQYDMKFNKLPRSILSF